MDLPEIGAHCGVCGELDLLPVKCNCEKLFCRRHFLPDVHDCPLNQSHAPSTSLSPTKRQRCAFEGCNMLSLDSVVGDRTSSSDSVASSCPKCLLSYCASHRHPSSHSCSTAVDNSVDKHGAVRNVLQRVLPAPTKPPLRNRVLKPSTMSATKLAQVNRVAVMQMRQRAIAGETNIKASSVDISDRLHVGVKVDNGEAEEFFWFRKNTSVGRAVDLIAARVGAVVSDDHMLCLEKADAPDHSERIRLSFDSVLSQVVTEGSHLILVRVSSQGDSHSSV